MNTIDNSHRIMHCTIHCNLSCDIYAKNVYFKNVISSMTAIWLMPMLTSRFQDALFPLSQDALSKFYIDSWRTLLFCIKRLKLPTKYFKCPSTALLYVFFLPDSAKTGNIFHLHMLIIADVALQFHYFPFSFFV